MGTLYILCLSTSEIPQITFLCDKPITADSRYTAASICMPRFQYSLLVDMIVSINAYFRYYS